MATFKHGIYYTETGSEAAPSIQYGQIPCYVGTAPIHLASGVVAETNKPVLISSMEEFRQKFGFDRDFESFTLCEAASYHFEYARISPIICINVLDAENSRHVENKTSQFITKTGASFIVSEKGIIKSTVVVKGVVEVDDGEDSMMTESEVIEDSNYKLSFSDEGYLVLTPTEDSSIGSAVKLSFSFKKFKVSGVSENDIIGSIDSTTGVKTGVQAVDYILSEIQEPPGILLCPGWSHKPTVVSAFVAKAENISGLFPALVFADIDSSASGARYHSTVKQWKDESGFNSVSLVACYPMVKKGDAVYHLSTVLAATKQGTMSVESAYNTPCESPSNKEIACDSLVNMAGDSIIMDLNTANLLNAAGIVTAFKQTSSFVVWGNYNTVYPENKNAKDCWISTRAMNNYMVTFIILAYWNKIDERATKTNLKNIEDSVNGWLAGLAAKEVIYSGSCTFTGIEDDGINRMVKFSLVWSDSKPAQAYQFDFVFDSSVYENFNLK